MQANNLSAGANPCCTEWQLAADGFKFPIIFMTGLNDVVIRSQAAAAGGIAFLHKPIPAKELIDAIKLVIG